MKDASKPIQFSQHAREQLSYRGTHEAEITAAIHSCAWEKAELGRLCCKKEFSYNKKWNNKQYKTKQVKPIFVEEKDKIVIVTVYVYYS